MNTGTVTFTVTLTDEGDPALGEQAAGQDLDVTNGMSDDDFAVF